MRSGAVNKQSLGIAVLGAGSWGTALALLLAKRGNRVMLWDRTAEQIASLNCDRENRRYLPGFILPPEIVPVTDIADAVANAEMVVVAVPSDAARSVLMAAKEYLLPGTILVLATKGLEPATGFLAHETAHDVLDDTARIVALSGPNLAGEVARSVPTAAVAASVDAEAAVAVRDVFNGSSFRLYTNTDIIGVEVGGAVKNVLAIAGGICEGLGFGDNTRAFLLTRGLAEMARFGMAMGGRRETFYGLAGVGDLMATAQSRLSRNFRVGMAIARGQSLDQILSELGQVAEGVTTARALQRLTVAKQVEMPVCQSVAGLLFEGKSPLDEVTELMTRTPKDE